MPNEAETIQILVAALLTLRTRASSMGRRDDVELIDSVLQTLPVESSHPLPATVARRAA